MATLTHLNQTYVTTNVATYASGAFTPPAGALLVVLIHTTTTGATPASESVTANIGGLTFTRVPGLEATHATSLRRSTVWVADQPCTAVSTTLTYTANTSFTSGYVGVLAVTGLTRVGVDAVKQFAVGIASATVAGSLTLPAACDTNNPTIVGFNAENGGTIPGITTAGWTAAHSLITVNTPSSTSNYHIRNSGFTGTTIAIATYNATRCFYVVEFNASAAGPVGTLTVAEEADSIVADASVVTPPNDSTLTRTEAPDTISASASSPIQASLVRTEAADTLVSTVPDYVTATLTRTEDPDTISATASVVQNQLASTFTEDFNDPIDTGKWTVTQVNGTVDFTGGTGNFTATPNAVGNRSAIVSVPNLDFREQRVFHKLVQPLRMVGDTNNTELAFTIEGPTTNRLDWVVYSGGSLSIVKFTNNTWASIKGDITTNIWANLATYQWLAFRVTGTNIYFETAPATASDPPIETDWVVQHSITVASQPVSLAAAKIVFQYYHNATTGTVLQPHKVDALNTATTPPVAPSNADLDLAEAPDTISASATVVEAAPVTATLTRTEAPDTIVATAGAPVTGNLSRAEAADTIVASASSGIGAALVLTEAPNTLTATASSPATGALAATEAGDTVTAAATSPVTGSLTRTEAQDTVASDASVLPFPVIGASLTVQEAPDQVASAAGSPAAIADFFRTEAPDTISASASSGISSTLTRTEAPDTIAAAATALAGATLVRAEAPDTIAAAASSPSTANLSSTEAPDTISASAKVAVGATLAVTEAGDTLSSSVSVAVPIFTTLDLTEAPDTLSATATVVLPPVTATLSVTEQADTSFMYTVHAKKRVILVT